MAAKVEINHDEKLKELYEQRAKENSEKIDGENALEGKARGKLVRFDNERVSGYNQAEKGEVGEMRGKVQEGVRVKERLGRAIGELEERIRKLDGEVRGIEDNAELSIARLKSGESSVAGRKEMARVREAARVERAKAIFEARNGIDAARVVIVQLQSEL